ncbi:MAG: diguanylate cyclase [Wenzhouxiangellaceae bacterium]
MRHQDLTKREPAAAGVMGWVLALGVLTVVFTLPFLWIAFVQSESEFLGEAQIFHGTISRHVNHSETVLTGFTTLYQALEARPDRPDPLLRTYARGVLSRYPHLHELSIEQRVARHEIPELAARMRAAGKTRFEHRGFELSGDNNWFDPPPRDEYFPLVFAEPEPVDEPLLGMDPSLDPITGSAMAYARETGRPAASSPFERVMGGHAYVVFQPLYDHDPAQQELTGFASLLVRAEDLVPADLIPDAADVTIRPERAGTDSLPLFEIRQGAVGADPQPLLPRFHFEQTTDGPGPRLVVEMTTSPLRVMGGQTLTVFALPAGLVLAVLVLLVVRLRAQRGREREAAAEGIFREKERAEVTLGAISDAVITTDADGNIEYMNPVAETLTGRSLVQARRQPFHQTVKLVRAGTDETIELSITDCIRNKRKIRLQCDVQIIGRSSRRTVENSASPLHDLDGTIIGAAVVFRDVTEQREAMRDMSWQADHDPLTGLFNRRVFAKRLQAALDEPDLTPPILCFIDLDRFKPINDEYGHAVGDQLLQHFAHELKAAIRDNDIAGRLGGDEFALLLYDCPIERAESIVDELHDKLDRDSILIDGDRFSIEFSAGLVPLTGAGHTLAEVMKRADSACYKAKRSNRNHVAFDSTAEV